MRYELEEISQWEADGQACVALTVAGCRKGYGMAPTLEKAVSDAIFDSINGSLVDCTFSLSFSDGKATLTVNSSDGRKFERRDENPGRALAKVVISFINALVTS